MAKLRKARTMGSMHTTMGFENLCKARELFGEEYVEQIRNDYGNFFGGQILMEMLQDAREDSRIR